MELDPKTEPQSKQVYVLLGSIAAIFIGFGVIAILLYLYFVMPGQ
ncbi:hypothetical protein B9G69_000805 [Bdellovibrio sp. SKB1291214]|nr:hypothetical protein [Bdellovibrio sp. SKB1291214]UYL09114.1 hypothetical protein B9G69_000805 [Bdellovibrio sp. SKB1291214]